MARAQSKRWTVEDVDALPDDGWTRYELVDGELLMSTAPRFEHQLVCTKGTTALEIWNDASGLGFVLVAPGLVFGRHDAAQPDFVWISRERSARVLDDKGHFSSGPELVVEVLSPGAANARRDRVLKPRQYSIYGVDEYWLIDWQAATVEVYRRQDDALRLVATLGADDTLTSPLLPGFALPIARLFPWR
jgi:Uma2 family endonuclease